MEDALAEFPVVKVSAGSTNLLYNGARIQEKYFIDKPAVLTEDEVVSVYDSENNLVGLYQLKKEETRFFIKPYKMLL